MSNGLIILCYCLAAYGLSNMVVFGSGPFRRFEWLRYLTNKVSEHFGTMFTCMMCFPANVGWICSLINWFFIPVAITPFNILLGAHAGLWWLAALCDCAFTSGVVWFIHHIEEYFETNSKDENVVTEEMEHDDVITVDDIRQYQNKINEEHDRNSKKTGD